MATLVEEALDEHEIADLAEELVEAYRDGESCEIHVEASSYALDRFSLQDFAARYVDEEEIPGDSHITSYTPEAEYVSSRISMYTDVDRTEEGYLVRMELPFDEDEVLEENY